jgi:uncharacterized membrane protein
LNVSAQPDRGADDDPAPAAPLALAILLLIGGIGGLCAAFALTLDEFTVLKNAHAALSCNVSAAFQCGTNLESWQGRVFGFPNPLIGLVLFPAPIIVGVALIGRVAFPRWFWALFNLGMLFAIGFVAWLVSESLWVLHTLCPWCSLVYLVVIPMSLAVTFQNLRSGNLNAGKVLKRLGTALYPWVPLISLVCYLIIGVTAQLKIDILSTL